MKLSMNKNIVFHRNDMLAKLFFVYIIYFMQALPSGEEGKQVSIGKSGDHRHLNRFKNVTACTCYILILMLASFPRPAH